MNKYRKIHRIRILVANLLRFVGWKSLRYHLNCGDPFVLHPGDNLSEIIYTGRNYEPLESNLMMEYLRSGDVVVDGGANIGYFTALCSNRVGATGRILAVEPGYRTLTRLVETINLLSLQNVTVCPFALWKEISLLNFNASTSGADAQQSIWARHNINGESRSVPVCSVSLDRLLSIALAETCGEVALIKVDVEGAEPAVLDGAYQAIQACQNPPLLIVECNKETLLSCGYQPTDLLSRLKESFELYYTPLSWPPWFTDQTAFIQVAQDFQNIPAKCNIAAIPKRGHFAKRLGKSSLLHRKTNLTT